MNAPVASIILVLGPQSSPLATKTLLVISASPVVFDTTGSQLGPSVSSCAHSGLKGEPELFAAFITMEGAYPMFLI